MTGGGGGNDGWGEGRVYIRSSEECPGSHVIVFFPDSRCRGDDASKSARVSMRSWYLCVSDFSPMVRVPTRKTRDSKIDNGCVRTVISGRRDAKDPPHRSFRPPIYRFSGHPPDSPNSPVVRVSPPPVIPVTHILVIPAIPTRHSRLPHSSFPRKREPRIVKKVGPCAPAILSWSCR